MIPLIVMIIGVGAMITALILAVRKSNRDHLRTKKEYVKFLEEVRYRQIGDLLDLEDPEDYH